MTEPDKPEQQSLIIAGHRRMLDKLLALTGLADSVSDAGRKLKQNAVKVNGEVTTDPTIAWDTGKDLTLRAGKKIKRVHFTK
jgi:ribosome-associated protein YbcJ (S4-like RNA binding protein)